MITQDHQNRLIAQGRNELMTAWLSALPSAPGETKQRDAADRFERVMETLVEELVGVIAAVDFPAFPVKLDNLDGKGKVVLKAADMDKAGPVLIRHMGASLTLVLTDVDQFDERRDEAVIEPDQRSMFPAREDGADELDGEAVAEDDGPIIVGNVIVDDSVPAGDEFGLDLPPEEGAPFEPVGPCFSAVEVGAAKDAAGAEVALWVLLHGDAEVFEPLAAGDRVQVLADALNARTSALGRNLTPFEVRDGVLGMSAADFGPCLKGAYTTEAIQTTPVAADDDTTFSGAKRGRKTAAEKVAAYFAGYDGAAAALFTEDCPHERGSLRDAWLTGLMDAKAGKPARWVRPAAQPANDDGAGSDVEAA